MNPPVWIIRRRICIKDKSPPWFEVQFSREFNINGHWERLSKMCRFEHIRIWILPFIFNFEQKCNELNILKPARTKHLKHLKSENQNRLTFPLGADLADLDQNLRKSLLDDMLRTTASIYCKTVSIEAQRGGGLHCMPVQVLMFCKVIWHQWQQFTLYTLKIMWLQW